MPKISQLTEITTPDDDMVIPILDGDSGQTKKITLPNLLSGVTDGSDIANQAILARHVDLSVADQTARDAIASPWAGLIVFQEDNEMLQIYDGASWLNIPRLLKQTVLSSAGDTISVSGIPKRNELTIVANCIAKTNSIAAQLRFNNDSGNNYAYRRSNNGGADSLNTSTNFFNDSGVIQNSFHLIAELTCFQNQEKVGKYQVSNAGAAGVANAPNRNEGVGKWVNTSSYISRVDCINASTGDYQIGSILSIYG